VYIQSEEDLILCRLMYLALSCQAKQAHEIAAIPRAAKDKIDFGYIEEWVARSGLGSVWKEMLDDDNMKNS
jgi:hypothetical protein